MHRARLIALVTVLSLVAGGVALISRREFAGHPLRVQVEGGSAQCELHGCVEGMVDTALGSLHPVSVDLRSDPLRPDLDLIREYDSAAVQGSFGPGWRSLMDVRLATRPIPRVIGAVGAHTLPAELVGHEVRFTDGTRWVFDGDGRLVAGTSAAGVSFSVHRTKSRIVVDGPDAGLTFRLDDHERVVAAWASGGTTSSDDHRVTYDYDRGGLLRHVRREPSRDARYAYLGPSGQITAGSGDGHDFQASWSRGRVTSLKVAPFTASYRLRYGTPRHAETEVTAPGAATPTIYRHDADSRLTRVSAGALVTLERTFDSSGRLISQRDDEGTIRYTWNANNLASSDRLLAGRWVRTTYRWDGLGRLLDVGRNGRHPRRLQYAGDSWQPVASIDETDRKTTFTYRGGLVSSVADADGVTTAIRARDGAVRATTAGTVADVRTAPAAEPPQPDPTQRSGRTDDSGRPTSINDSSGTTRLGYDGLGRVDDVRSPAGDEHLTFDAHGRVATRRIASSDHRWSYAWDDAGRLSQARTDCPAREAGSCSTKFTYDDDGRLLHEQGPSGSLDRSYDAAGRVDTITRNGTRWSVARRTRAGRPAELQGPEGHVVSFTYDQGGRIASERAAGTTTRFRYEQGLLAAEERGGVIVRFAHDRAGRISGVTTPLARYGYRYDAHGRLIAVSGPGRDARYRYDRAGQLVSQRFGTTRIDYRYDGKGRIVETKSAVDGKKERTSTFHYRRGQLVSIEGDGRDASVGYGKDGRPAVVRDGDGEERWTWRTDGRLDHVERGDHRFDLRYDRGHLQRITDDGEPLAQLTWHRRAVSVSSGDRSASATWDALGNPIELRRAGERKGVRYAYTREGAVAEVRRGDDVAAAVKWRNGLPTGVTTPSGSLRFACEALSCAVESAQGDDRLKLDYRDGALAGVVRNDYALRFRTDAAGRVTNADRSHGSSRKDGEFKNGEWTGGLGKSLQRLLGDDRMLPGLSSTPLLPSLPAVEAIPSELRPEGLAVDLPDDVVAQGLAARTPSLPAPMMNHAGGDDWSTGLLGQLAPTRSPALQVGPFAMFDQPGLSVGEASKADWWHGADPLGDQGWGSVHKTLAKDLRPGPSFFHRVSSIARPVLSIVLHVVPDLVLWAGSYLFGLGIARTLLGSAVGIAAGIACVLNKGSCSTLVAVALFLVAPPLGRLGLFLVQDVGGAAVDAVAGLLHGSTFKQALLGFAVGVGGAAVAIGVGLRLAARACRLGRVTCYPAQRFPETAASYANARRGRLLQVGRADAGARRAEALAGVEPRAGFDRDEFPPAFTRQGGAGALVTYVPAAENRAAGAFLGHSVRDLRDGQRFLFLVTDLPSQSVGLAHAAGASAALVVTGQARGGG